MPEEKPNESMLGSKLLNRVFWAKDLGALMLSATRSFLSKHASQVALALILLLAAYLRLEGLGDNSLWVDECIVANHALAGGVIDVIRSVARDIHPPLLHLIAHFAMKVGGRSELVLRLPSAISGIAACFFTFALARLVVRDAFSLLAAFLLAVCPLAIDHSQQLRPYSLLCLLGALTTIAFIRLAQQPTAGRTVKAIIFGALTLYTHYVGITYLLSLFGAVLCVCWNSQKVRRALSTAAFGVFLTFSPWIHVLAMHVGERPEHLQPYDLSAVSQMFTTQSPFSALASPALKLIANALFFFAVAAGIVGVALRLKINTNRERFTLVCCLSMFALLGYAISLYRPFYRPGIGLVLYPVLMVLSALGIRGLSRLWARSASRRMITACFVAPVVALGMVNASQYTAHRFVDGRRMALYVRDNIVSEPIVLDCVFHGTRGFEFYLPLACPDYPSSRILLVTSLEDLEAKMGRIRRLGSFWLVSVGDGPSPLWTLATQHLKQVKSVSYHKIRAALFTWPEATESRATDPQESSE